MKAQQKETVSAISEIKPKNQLRVAPLHVITSKKFKTLWSMRELWAYRGVFLSFSVRDMKLRYRQTVLGVFWTIIQPLMATGIFSIFLGQFAKIPSDGIPYPLFVYTAILPWNFFSGCVSRGSTSIVGNSNLLTKVYFPRILIPTSCLVTPIVDFLIGMFLLIPVCLYFGFQPPITFLVTFPLLLVLSLSLSLGISFWLSTVHVRFRDVGNMLGLILQLWMFCTPVIYPVSIVTEKYQWLYYLNPMVGIISGFRSVFLGTGWNVVALTSSVAVTLLLLLPGAYFFRYSEDVLADVV